MSAVDLTPMSPAKFISAQHFGDSNALKLKIVAEIIRTHDLGVLHARPSLLCIAENLVEQLEQRCTGVHSKQTDAVLLESTVNLLTVETFGCCTMEYHQQVEVEIKMSDVVGQTMLQENSLIDHVPVTVDNSRKYLILMDASTIILESSDIRIQFSSMSPVEVALTALQILKTAGNTNSFQEHFSKLIFVLRGKIAGHFVETAEMADLLDEIEEKYRSSKKVQTVRILNSLIHLLRPVDLNLLVDILKKNMLTADVIKGRDIVLFVGNTGTGKSTAANFLSGAKMAESVIDGIRHISSFPLFSCDGLEYFVTSPLPKSETKAIRAIELREYGDPIWLVDTPGFGDTDGVEADISNGLYISSAVKLASSVRVVVLVSDKGLGDRGEGVELLINKLLRFANLSLALDSFTFLFTKFQKSDASRISTFFTQKLENLSHAVAHSDTFCEILSAMIEQLTNNVFIVDPLHDDPKILVHAILQTPSIACPKQIFKDFVSPESLSKLKNQLSLDTGFVSLKIKQLEEAAFTGEEIDSAIEAISIKVTQIMDLKHSIQTHDCETAFEDCKRYVEGLTLRSLKALESAIELHVNSSPTAAHQCSEVIGRQLCILLVLDRSIAFIHVGVNCSSILSETVQLVCSRVKDLQSDIVVGQHVERAKLLFSLHLYIQPYVNYLGYCIDVFEYLDRECNSVVQFLDDKRNDLILRCQEAIQTGQYVLGAIFSMEIQSLSELLSKHGIREVCVPDIGVIQATCYEITEKLSLVELDEEQISHILSFQSQLREISSREEIAGVVDAAALLSMLSTSIEAFLLKSVSLVRSMFARSVDHLTLENMNFAVRLLRQTDSFGRVASAVSGLAIEYKQEIVHTVKYCLHNLLSSGRDIIKLCCGSTDRLQEIYLILEFSSTSFGNLSAQIYTNEFEVLLCELLLVVDMKKIEIIQKPGFECLRILSDAFDSIQFIRDCDSMMKRFFPVYAVPEMYTARKTIALAGLDGTVSTSEHAILVSAEIESVDLDNSNSMQEHECPDEITPECASTVQSDKRKKQRGHASAKKHGKKRSRALKQSKENSLPLAIVNSVQRADLLRDDTVVAKMSKTSLPLILTSSIIDATDENQSLQGSFPEVCIECEGFMKEYERETLSEPVEMGDSCRETYSKNSGTVADAITGAAMHFDLLLQGLVMYSHSIISVPMKCGFHCEVPKHFASVTSLVGLCRRWSGFNEEANRLRHSHIKWTAIYFEQLQICIDKSFAVILSLDNSSFIQRKEATKRVSDILVCFTDHDNRSTVLNEDEIGYSSHQMALQDSVINGHLRSAETLLSDTSISNSIRWEIASCCTTFDIVGETNSIFKQFSVSLELQCDRESTGVCDQMKILIGKKCFDQALELLTDLKGRKDEKSKKLYELVLVRARDEVFNFRQHSRANVVSSIKPAMVKNVDCVFPDVSVILEDILLVDHPLVKLPLDQQPEVKPEDLIQLFLERLLVVIPRIQVSLAKRLFLQVASWEFVMDKVEQMLWQNSEYCHQRNEIRELRSTIDTESEIRRLVSEFTSSIPQVSFFDQKATVISSVEHTLLVFKNDPPRDLLQKCTYLVEHNSSCSLCEGLPDRIREVVQYMVSSIVDSFSLCLIGMFDKETRQKLRVEHARDKLDSSFGFVSTSEMATIITTLEKAASYVSTDVHTKLQPLFSDCRAYCSDEQQKFAQRLKSLSDNRQFHEIIAMCRDAFVVNDQESVQQCLLNLTVSMQKEIDTLQRKLNSRDLSSFFIQFPDIWHNLEASFTVLEECDDFVTASIRDRADNLKRRLGAKISQLSELVSSALDFKSRNRDIFRFNVQEMVRCFQWMKEFVFCRTPVMTNERENASSDFSHIAATFPEWIHVEELISKGFDDFIAQFSRCGQYIQKSLLDLSAIDMTDGQRRCVLENIEKVLSSYSTLTPLFELIAAFFADQRAALYNSDLANSFQNIPSLDSMRTRIETVVYEWSQEMEQDLLCNTEVVASSLSSVRDAFFKKFGRIYRLLVESKIPLAKYGLNQAGQGYSVHIKSQLTAIGSKATAMIPAFPQEDSEFLAFNNLCDMLRSFKDNFQGAQLQGFAKNLFDEIEKRLKMQISEVLKIVDAELVNDVADILYEDVVDTLIDVKSMALVLFLFQDAINRKIDVSLSKCKVSVNGNKKIGMLSVELNRRESTDSKGSDGLAQRIIAEHQAFKGFALSLRNTKTVNFTITEVLEGLQLEAALADELRTAYRQFEADYWKLVESGLGNTDFKCQELVAEVSNFSPRSSCPLIRRVLFYVVRIFAFWTLSNASDFLEAVVEHGDEEDMHRTARCPLKVDLLMKKVRQILAASNDHESLLLNESRASIGDVKSSFRKLSLILHPDKLTTSPDRSLSEEDKGLCSAAYLKVKEAYEILISRRKVSAGEVSAEDSLEDKKKQSRSFILQPHAAQVVSVLLYFAG
eukprot:gene21235-27514_t